MLLDGNAGNSLGLTLAATNTGSLELRGLSNTYTGGTKINGGTLSVSADGNLGDPNGSLSFGGGNLVVTGALTTVRPLAVNISGGTIDVAAGTLLSITGAGTTQWAGGTLTITDAGTASIARSGASISVTPGSTLSVGSLSTATVDATEDPFTDSIDATHHVAILNSGTFAVTAGSSTIARHRGSGTLIVNGGALLRLAATGSGNSAGVLTIDTASGSQLDLANNAFVVNYSGASPDSAIRAALISGRAGGAWSGAGINSSTANAVAMDGSNLHKTAIGYAEASSVTSATTFFGEPIDSTTVLMRYTVLGDANLDGTVNALDFNAVATNFGSSTNREWSQGDFNYDGKTNTLDFMALATNFNQALPAPAAPLGLLSLGSLVPEPGTGALLLAGCSLLFRRDRRRKTESL